MALKDGRMKKSSPKSADKVESLTQVVEQLEEDIVFGRRRPRERLVEEDLVEQFGLKRHVIRQALQELERVGMVVRLRGRGARVREFSPVEVQQLYAVRELLEVKAANLIPLPANKELVRQLTVIQRAHSKGVDTGDLRTIFRENIRFHQVLFAACGNPYLSEAINQFAMKSNIVRFYVGRDHRMFAGSRDQHFQIIEALKTGHRDQLIEICIAHLKPSPKAYIEAYHALFGED